MKTAFSQIPGFKLMLVLAALTVAVQLAGAANKAWDGGGGDGFWQTAFNWDANTAPAPGDALVFGSTTRLNSTNNFAAGTGFGGISFSTPAGAFALYGNALELNGNLFNNQPVTAEAINLPLVLTGQRNANVSDTAILAIGGSISGSFGLSKSGGGLLALGGANTYNGSSIITAGTLSIAGDGNLGTPPAVATPGSIVISNGTLRGSAGFTLDPNRGIALGPQTGTGQGRMDVASGSTVIYRGIVANNGGTGGLTKGLFGGLTLSRANTYTGPTIVKNGTLTLDFTAGDSPVIDVISSTSSLTLGGENAGLGAANRADLTVNGGAVANVQSLSGTQVESGPAVVRALGGSGTVTVNLGTLTHVPGGQLVFHTNATGRLNTTTANTHGILGGWVVTGNGGVFNNVTMGTEFATVDGGGNIGPYTGYTVHQNALGNLDTYVTAATNLRIDGTSSGDVRLSAEGAGSIIDVNTINLSATRAYSLIIGTNNTLRFGRFGGIFKSDNANNITWAFGSGTTAGGNGVANSGTVTAGGAPNTDGEIVFALNNGTSQSQGSLNLEARVTDNGTGKVTLVKSGPQAMKLRGQNTHSGGLYLLQGRLQLAGSELGAAAANPGGGGTGSIIVLPGAQLFPSGIGDFNTTGVGISNNIFMGGLGTQQEQFGAIRLGNGTRINGDVLLIGDSRIGGGNGGASGISGRISGDYNFDLGALVTINSIFTLYNPANDWSGTTTFNGRSGGNNTINNGASDVIPHGFGKGNVVMNANAAANTITWNLNGFNETINGLSTANNPASCFIQNNAGGTVSILTVGANDQSGEFAGQIQDGGGTMALNKVGGGQLTLSGTTVYSYTGDTTVNGGSLALTGEGSISSSPNIQVNAGALDVAGLTTDFTAIGTVSVSGGTLVANAVNATIPALNLTNAGLTVTLNPSEVNVATTTLTTSGTNLINVFSVVNISGYPTPPMTVIDYSGGIGGAGYNFGLGAVPSAVTTGYVSNDVANSRVVVVLLNGPKPLTWQGGDLGGPNDWDVGLTENWLAFKGTANEEPASFFAADGVFLDDTATTNRLNLVGVLTPGGVTVENQSLNYIFTGSGLLSGQGGLVKRGTGSLLLENTGVSDFRGGIAVNGGSLTLASANAISGGMLIGPGTLVRVGTNGNSGNLPSGNVNHEGVLTFNRGSAAYTVPNRIIGSGSITKNDTGALTLSGANNTYTGAVQVASGTLRLGSATALGTVDGNTTVANGAALDVNGVAASAEAVIVSGPGVNGTGAIINTGADQINALQNVTLAGHTTFGGSARWDIRGGVETLSTENNAYNLTKVGNNQFSLVGVAVDGALANITVSNGIFSVETDTSGLGNPANTFTVYTNGTLQLFNNTTPLDKVFQLYGNGLTNTVNIASGMDNSIIGAVTLNGTTVFNYGGAFGLALNGTVGGPGSLLLRGGGTLTLNGAASYAGNTTIAAGTLVINSINSGGGTLTNASGTLITGHGTNTGAARLTGTLLPGGTNVAGPFGTGNLTISNLNATFDLATADYNNISPANDAVYSSGTLTLQGTNTFTMNPAVAGVLTNTQVITLIQYNGALSGGSNNLRIVSPVGYTFRLLDPATTPNAIRVVVDKAPLILAWRGGAAGNATAWDVATTANWVNAADNVTPAVFTNFDVVTFSDTQNTNFIALTGALQPGSMTANNNAVTLTWGGAGRITGNAPLTVQGGGTLIIANSGSNDFTGAVNLNSGTLQIGNGGTGGNLGPGSITNQGNLVFNRTGTLTVNNVHGSGSLTNNGLGTVTLGGANTYDGTLAINQGTIRAASASALGSVSGPTVVAGTGTLDVNGQTLNLEQVNVRGAGVGGNGAIVNHGADSLNALFNVTLDGHTVFGGTNRWDIRGEAGAASLSTSGQAYNLTKVGAGQFSLVNAVVDSALADIIVLAGTFSSETTTTGLGDPTRNFTLAAGATWQIFNSATSWDKHFLLTGNGVANTINVSSGTGNNIIGPMMLTGPCLINVTAANELAVPVPNPVDGTGSLAKNGTGTLNLSGPLSYAGNTSVNGGTLRLSGVAALTNSPVVTVGAGASLDVSLLADGSTLRRLNGQTLMGNGSINGSVNIAAGATVAPGLSIGVLTVTNDVGLSGTTLMEVQSSPSTNDRLRSIQGTITYGGTLVVTNVGPITGTNTYQLFVGALAGTSFASISLPTLPGVSWNTANLNVNGTITAIQTLNPTPINLSFSFAGNALDISWPADHTGWRLEGQTNGVNVGISSNWALVPGSTLTNRVIVPVSPANGTVFYRLVLPLQ